MCSNKIVKYYKETQKGIPIKNFGDIVSPYIVELITGEPVVRVGESYKAKKKEIIYLVCGSILAWADKNSVVWGSGFISADRKVQEKPKSIKAVRGKLSRDILTKQGIRSRKIYGDPVLLLPDYHTQQSNMEYRLGVIPHYADLQLAINLPHFTGDPDVLMININASIQETLDAIWKCEKIISSSLHGLVLADAYGIANGWVEFSDNVLGKGFKFFDYFSGMEGDMPDAPLRINTFTSMLDIWDCIKEPKVHPNFDKFMSVCPFKG